MNNVKAIAEVTKKIVQDQFSDSVIEVLKNLHVETDTKKMRNLIKKASERLVRRVIRNLRKAVKTKR